MILGLALILCVGLVDRRGMGTRGRDVERRCLQCAHSCCRSLAREGKCLDANIACTVFEALGNGGCAVVVDEGLAAGEG